MKEFLGRDTRSVIPPEHPGQDVCGFGIFTAWQEKQTSEALHDA